MSSKTINVVNPNGLVVQKSTDFNEWYIELLKKCQLISYTDVSGCYVLLPQSYAIWEIITNTLNVHFKKSGIKNTYFPLFITQKQLQTEKDHIEGFSAEVATVTKVGSHKIDDEINYLAIRPTSECAIYPIYKTLIRSYKDLPLKYNQFCNVVRWEFKDTMPFIRSREFLWSETHNCFTSSDVAIQDVNTMIDLYSNVIFKDLLAIPTITGTKTNLEKFSGAVSTRTIECIIPEVGKGVQAATCHYLGQIFSKAFDITYRNDINILEHVHQTCHGITTRSIGIALMTHSDNKGLVLPPVICETQVVIIVIKPKDKVDQENVFNYAKFIEEELLQNNIRVILDNNDNETMGSKCNKYELQGIPVRLEVGLRDFNESSVILARRDTLTKEKITGSINSLPVKVFKVFNDVHNNLLNKATLRLLDSIVATKTKEEFTNNVANKKTCVINWCNIDECEKDIKTIHGVKSFCLVDTETELGSKLIIGLPSVGESDVCMFCGYVTKARCLFGKSY